MPIKIKKKTNNKRKKDSVNQTPAVASPLGNIAKKLQTNGKKEMQEQTKPEKSTKPPKKPFFTKKNALILLPMTAIAALLIFIGIQDRYNLVMQTDYSVNFRVAYLDKYDKTPEKDQYIAFTFQAIKDSPKYGNRFVKRVACLPGEELSMKGREFYCNNVYLGTAKTHGRDGKPAPLFVHQGKVPENVFFASGETKDSYDSKYWGFVPNSLIIGKVKKIL